MSRINRSLVAFIAIVLSAGCDSKPAVFDAKVTVKKPPVNDVLSRYCSGCHGLPKPETKSAAQWPAVVWRMQTHRTQRAMRLLNESELNEITNYLTLNAKDP